MSRESRPYELRARAESMDATRRRITEATVELHGTVGPARTTVAAIAEAAGVQRHTVYRHFPTEQDLFTACAQHYWADHPWPDPATWEALDDSVERLRAALTAMYRFYADIEPMLANVLRDAEVMEPVARNADLYHGFVRDTARSLAPRRASARAVVAHTLEFATWRSLVRTHGVASRTAVDLMVSLAVTAGLR